MSTNEPNAKYNLATPINYSLPQNRCGLGRTGRCGSYGLALQLQNKTVEVGSLTLVCIICSLDDV